MPKYYLAVDIGASSGRMILSHLENGLMETREIHRFVNGLVKKNGHLCWETERLFGEIISGMKKCANEGITPESIGIDTWAVDYVLLDNNNKLLGDTVGYRDSRTDGISDKVYSLVPEAELYARTGIQKQPFNTVFQLMAVKENTPELLDKAETLLMIPDYFNYLLSGVKCCEYTNATTTALVSPETKNWDMTLIEKLGYPKKIFAEISAPGTILGTLLPEIATEVGFNCNVVLPATHDTGSAVVAVPSVAENVLYISSGTWSLMGIERLNADCSVQSEKENFTNEGGYDFRFRYLKNIMGLWMIQSAKKEYGKYSFDELCSAAEQADISSTVDCNDSAFLAPESMIEAVKAACREASVQVPETPGEVARVIYHSLAKCYADTADRLEKLTGKHFPVINIVGGGTKDEYLSKLTAYYSKRTVLTGPTEATAIGNLLVQMIAAGEIKALTEARKITAASFSIKRIEPAI